MRFYPAFDNFPSGDDAADARRVNTFIEDRVRENTPQYLWTHKRFKTRPPGEASLTDEARMKRPNAPFIEPATADNVTRGGVAAGRVADRVADRDRVRPRC